MYRLHFFVYLSQMHKTISTKQKPLKCSVTDHLSYCVFRTKASALCLVSLGKDFS